MKQLAHNFPKLSSVVTVIALFAFLATSEAKPKRLSSYEKQVKALLSQMTLDEKVGQMTQPDQQYLQAGGAEIETLFIGSLLSGGDSDPKPNNGFQAWSELYQNLQKHTEKTRLRIPLLYGIDAVHGHNNVLGATIFPHNIALGCTRDADLVEKIGRATAVEMRATGIHWTFAPCVTVPQDERWGRTYEGFSEDPAIVAKLSKAAVEGLQGSLSDPMSVLACAKHYIGDGGTTFGAVRRNAIDQGDTRVSEDVLRKIHLPGYITAIKAGVGTIMPSYSSWNGVKCSASKKLMTDILKDELGFEGFLISDYNAIDQITNNYKTAIGISINAGMDMVMVPQNYRAFISNLKALVQEGTVPMTRIDDAVTRILRVKFAMGLMETNRAYTRAPEKEFGSAEHRALARKAVQESLVLLKNNSKTLPISKTLKRIHVGGKCADDIGNQCGGWTITWQGKSGETTPGGTTILSGIKQIVSKNTQVTYSRDGSEAAGADVGIVVIGETPYAEGMGDRADLSLSREDVAVITNMKSSGIPVVVVLVSGRPMIINEALDNADAFVAAWLPGTEGAGVADVLFGDAKFKGKLAHSWPRSMAQIPINGEKGSEPLFKIGFGLK